VKLNDPSDPLSIHMTDMFGNPVYAVRGKSGTAIITRLAEQTSPTEEDEDEDDDTDQTISLSAESATAFAKWIQPKAPHDDGERKGKTANVKRASRTWTFDL
jgi:hypothetical protein